MEEKKKFFQFPQLKYWKSIEDVLIVPVQNVDDFIALLFKIYQITKPQKISQKAIDDYLGNSLRNFFNKNPETSEKFFRKILPGIINLAIQFPVHIRDDTLPLLNSLTDQTVTLTRVLLSCLLANGFLCTFGMDSERPGYPPFEFSHLYSSLHHPQEAAKMFCLLNYFDRVSEVPPSGNLTIHRQVLNSMPDFSKSDKLLKGFRVEPKASIEHFKGALQVDFANKYLGGGVLVGGCVQEEIRFAINTELIACCLFCEMMKDNEAIIITGSEQYSNYSGYAFQLTYAGNFIDNTPLMQDGVHINTTICAIDATDYRMGGLDQQFTPHYLKREVEKAYTGFFTPNDDEKAIPVATGNWGCGAFLGNVQHKCLVQYIAASEAERNLIYCTFNDKSTEQMKQIVELLSGKTVGFLWEKLVLFHSSGSSGKVQAFDFIKNLL